MAITSLTDSTSEPRSFSVGPRKLQLVDFVINSGVTSGTITADKLSTLNHILIPGLVVHTAAPTYATNVATLAITVPAETLASRVIQDITYTAVPFTGAAGNSVTIAYPNTLVTATLTVQDILYTAKQPGTGGNSITITYTTGATAGDEVVTVVGNAISVQIETTVSTATQVMTKVTASAAAQALITNTLTGTGSNAQIAAVSTPLAGGTGAFTVSVVGLAISVPIHSGVTEASVIDAALTASAAAQAVATQTISGTDTTAQTVITATALQNGVTGGARGTALCIGIE